MAAPALTPWVAVDPVADRVDQALALRRLHEAFQGGLDVGERLRAVVTQSWQRSGAAGIDPEHHLAPIVMDEGELSDRWHAHPLFPVLPVLRRLLSDATSSSAHMLVISDAQGMLLWIEGHQRVIKATENMHFVCGADWSESGAGTNALGTAIALDHPVQIFSAEHFNRKVHPWQCSGAPIHDPATGEILGVVDLTGHLKTAHPHTLALVTAAAGMAEAYLREDLRRRDERLRERYLVRAGGRRRASALIGPGGRVLMTLPHGWTPGADVVVEPLPGGEGEIVWEAPKPGRAGAAPPAPLRLELLSGEPCAHLDGERIPLSRRHAELLAVLLLSRRGMTAEQLTLEVHGERGKPVTVRAELSRLRRLLGPALQARPYRLAEGTEADVLDVRRQVEAGEIEAALEAYADPLLPASEVPLVGEERASLDGSLRRAVLQDGRADLLARWCETGSGREDLPATELLLGLLDADDPRVPAIRARAERLRTL
jgi:hypothetical protein